MLIEKIVFLLCSCVFAVRGENIEVVARVIGGEFQARNVAEEMGYIYKGQVVGFDDTYIFHLGYRSRSYQKRARNYQSISNNSQVVWIEQQVQKSRQKRDFLDDILVALTNRRKLHKEKTGEKPLFNDELWTQEWYLQDTRSDYDLPKLDLNVLPLYEMGITGKGVRISILDDGLEYTHDDLKDNYDPSISFDSNENDNDPLPRYDKHKINSHGTRCAGEVAMSANNGKCGVGVAFNAKIGGVKLLDGVVTDRIEGVSLGYAYNLVDIYSASWGPNDDGKTVDGPGRLALESLDRGIKHGRNGKGAIFVWASGNGGSKGDNCNCDGYLASPYTVSIGSASQKGEFPWYGEACASTLAVTYSSGAYKDQMIATTDLHNECTIKHTGTSASAPLAAGIIALALEVNKNLTWRDVQHLIVATSEIEPIFDNPGWRKNGAGFWFNTRFGFGLMNAFNLVTSAQNWVQVPLRQTCKTPLIELNKTITFGTMTQVEISSDDCFIVKFLEHVEIEVSLEYPVRGALEMYLQSPSGSEVEILAPRPLDQSRNGFKKWTFMSVMSWGELAQGVWVFSVGDEVGPGSNQGVLTQLQLTLYGTSEIPNYLAAGPRIYNSHYNYQHNSIKKLY